MKYQVGDRVRIISRELAEVRKKNDRMSHG